MGMLFSDRCPKKERHGMFLTATGAGVLSVAVGNLMAHGILVLDFLSALGAITISAGILVIAIFALMAFMGFARVWAATLSGSCILFVFADGIMAASPDRSNWRILALLLVFSAMLIFIRAWSEGPEPDGWRDSAE